MLIPSLDVHLFEIINVKQKDRQNVKTFVYDLNTLRICSAFVKDVLVAIFYPAPGEFNCCGDGFIVVSGDGLIDIVACSQNSRLLGLVLLLQQQVEVYELLRSLLFVTICT